MQTQMAGIVAAVATVLVALFLTPLFEGLPEATLGGIVIVAVSGMIKVGRIKQLYALRKIDFALALVAMLAVLSFDTLVALVFAVALSIVRIAVRAARAPVRRLGQLPEGGFADLERHPDARAHPTTLVVRPDAELFFANAESIVDSVYADATGAEPPARAVVLDLEMTYDLDVPAAEALLMLANRLADAGVPLALARVHGSVLGLLEKTGVVAAVGSDRVGGRVQDAVRALESLSTDRQAKKP
jgi:MFS superfamily sulfate permease-like transporter